MEILRKITIKGMGCQPKPQSVEKAAPVARIYGLARGAKVGTSNFGEFVRFSGQFEGVSLVTGEVFQSGSLILPATIESLLHDAVIADQDTEHGGSGAGVQFAVEIGVKPSESSKTGYEWTVKPLVKPAENDALAALRDQMKALPAPEAKGESHKTKSK